MQHSTACAMIPTLHMRCDKYKCSGRMHMPHAESYSCQRLLPELGNWPSWHQGMPKKQTKRVCRNTSTRFEIRHLPEHIWCHLDPMTLQNVDIGQPSALAHSRWPVPTSAPDWTAASVYVKRLVAKALTREDTAQAKKV